MKRYDPTKELRESLKMAKFEDPMKEIRDSMKAARFEDPMKELRESLKMAKFEDPMKEVRDSMKAARFEDPMKEMRDLLKKTRFVDPMRELRESLKISGFEDPVKELRDSLKATRLQRPLDELRESLKFADFHKPNKTHLSFYDTARERSAELKRRLDLVSPLGELRQALRIVDSAVPQWEAALPGPGVDASMTLDKASLDEVAEALSRLAVELRTKSTDIAGALLAISGQIRSLANARARSVFATYVYPLILSLFIAAVGPVFNKFIPTLLGLSAEQDDALDVTSRLGFPEDDSVLRNLRVVVRDELPVRSAWRKRSRIVARLEEGTVVAALQKHGRLVLICYASPEGTAQGYGWVPSKSLKKVYK